MSLSDIFGAITPQIMISKFSGRRDNNAKTIPLDVQGFRNLFRVSAERSEKDGKAWSPTIFDGGKRASTNALQICALVLDFDGGHDPYDFTNAWATQGLGFIVHSTHSSTPDVPKWRAIFLFETAYSVREHGESRWKELHRYYADVLGGGVADPVEDVARLYYLPAHKPGSDPFYVERDGSAIDWRKADTKLIPDGREALNGQRRAGDIYNEVATWEEILEPHGWTKCREKYGNLDLWQRPGENANGDHCARTGVGHIGDRFINWSSDPSVRMFEQNKPYDKLGVYARLNHGGDIRAAVAAVARDPRVQSQLPAQTKPEPRPNPKTTADTGRTTDGLRTIETHNRELRDVTDDALGALTEHNDPPRIFARDGVLARIETDERGQRAIRPLSVKALRGLMARSANWTETRKSGTVHIAPPLCVVDDILALGQPPATIPAIEGLSACPVVTKSGHIHRSGGYDAGSGWYVHGDVDVPKWTGSGEEAAEWLQNELLGDFPFADAASKANALALFLLPYLRPLIDEPTPLHLVDAPTPGTGKSLLVKACLTPALGRLPAATPIPEKEADFSKLLFSLLLEGKQVVFLDNLGRLLSSDALAAVLTAGELSDRILGLSSTPTVRVRAVLAATSNNGRLSEDIARRTVWIRLDAQMEDPEKREAFKRPKILAWARMERAAIISAAIGMIEEWQRKGRPSPKVRKGSFEEWAEVVGGVLEACNVPGFIANDKELKTSADESGAMWRAFYAAWAGKWGTRDVSVKDLREMAEGMDVMDPIFARAANDRGRATAFGRALSGQEGRVLGGLAPRKSTQLHGLSRFKLAPVGGQGDLISILRVQEKSHHAAHDSHTLGVGDSVHLSTSQVQNGVDFPAKVHPAELSGHIAPEDGDNDRIDEVEL